MSRHPLLEALDRRALVLDGATGTGLMALRPDVDPARGLERFVVEDPDTVRALHASHVAAGCDLVRTNTFCGSERELEAVGLGGRAREVARRAAEIAREAAGSSGGRDDRAPFVLGVIGPGRETGPWDAERYGAVEEAGRSRVEGLIDGGVDGFLIETARDPLGALAAMMAVRSVDSTMPFLVSATVEPDGRLASGAPLDELVAIARTCDAALLALNCSGGPESLVEPLGELRSHWDGRLGAWPNAGLPSEGPDGLAWPVGPPELATWCARAAREHDLRIVGGCCGTTAEHVVAIVAAMRDSETRR